MIIDCHTHIGRNEHINASADELLRSMDTAGIDKSLVFAGRMNDCPNEYLLEQLNPHKDRLLPVLAIHPKWIGEAHPKYYQELYNAKRMVAVKFYTGYDHFYPHEAKSQKFGDEGDYLAALEEVGCPVIFHCGDCLNSVKAAKLKYAHPLGVDDVAVDHPKNKYIIAHMGYPWHRDAAEVCYKNNNTSADISGFVYGAFNTDDKRKFIGVISEFISIAGQGTLLFGSDWPISNQKSYKDMVLGIGDDAPYFDRGLWNVIHDIDFLTAGNADHVFKLGLDL